MKAITQYLARNGRKGGKVRSEAKKAAARLRAAILWDNRRQGLTPLPLLAKYREEPCRDAEQIGATADGRAVWQRDGQLFRVVWQTDLPQMFAVPEDQVARRHAKPIPWEELQQRD